MDGVRPEVVAAEATASFALSIALISGMIADGFLTPEKAGIVAELAQRLAKRMPANSQRPSIAYVRARAQRLLRGLATGARTHLGPKAANDGT